MLKPPDTLTTWPVSIRAGSDASQATAAAMSTASGRLRSGVAFSMSAMILLPEPDVGLPQAAGADRVGLGDHQPGHTVFERTP